MSGTTSMPVVRGRAATIVETRTSASPVVFHTPDGDVTANVFKARSPDVELSGVQVSLLEESDAQGGARYAVMVDDPWWGRRIQPVPYQPAPFTTDIVMGYRIEARILIDHEPTNGEGLSLELTWHTAEDGPVVGWFPDVHNSLMWSEALQTYVKGPDLVWPITTRHDPSRDEDGWAAFYWPGLRFEDVILPRGHGAIFQRAGDELYDGWLADGNALKRHLSGAEWVYRGCRKPAAKGSPAVFDIKHATVTFAGAPGAVYEFGALDEDNPPSGGGVLGPDGRDTQLLEPAEYWAWQHDDSIGLGDRVGFEVEPGETITVNLPAMRTSGLLVYKGGAEPAAGVTVYLGSSTIPLGQTDESGYFDSPDGVGDINDPELGYQSPGAAYGNVVYMVTGGRLATARWLVWREPAADHPNFRALPGAVHVYRTNDGATFAMEEAKGDLYSYVTKQRLPRNSPAQELDGLGMWDPSSVTFYTYRIRNSMNEVLGQRQLEPLVINMPSSGYTFPPGPSLGGKIHGCVLRQSREQVEGTDAPFKLIEFGQHAWFMEHRQLPSDPAMTPTTCFADLVCPYCGGRAWVEPDEGAYVRGYCQYCAAVWGVAMKTDCRTHFQTKSLPPG
jgi:hypothetical protein